MVKPFFVRYKKVLKRIEPEKVMFLMIERNYTKIFLSDDTCYQVRTSLAGALERLPPDMFIKIHRSWAVSIYFIDHIAKDHLVIEGQAMPIGPQYYKSFIRQLNIIE